MAEVCNTKAVWETEHIISVNVLVKLQVIINFIFCIFQSKKYFNIMLFQYNRKNVLYEINCKLHIVIFILLSLIQLSVCVFSLWFSLSYLISYN